MSEVLDYVRSKDPRFKEVSDDDLALYVGNKKPDFLQDKEFKAEFETANLKKNVAALPKIALDQYQKARLSGIEPNMGTFGPAHPEEVLALPQVLKAPGALLEMSGITDALEQAGADFLNRTGINPSAQPGVPLAPERDQTTFIPSPVEEAFPEVTKGIEEALRGFTTPGAAIAAPVMAGKAFPKLSKIVEGGLGGVVPAGTVAAAPEAMAAGFRAQMAAGIPEAVQALVQSRTPADISKAGTTLIAQILATVHGSGGAKAEKPAKLEKYTPEKSAGYVEGPDFEKPPAEKTTELEAAAAAVQPVAPATAAALTEQAKAGKGTSAVHGKTTEILQPVQPQPEQSKGQVSTAGAGAETGARSKPAAPKEAQPDVVELETMADPMTWEIGTPIGGGGPGLREGIVVAKDKDSLVVKRPDGTRVRVTARRIIPVTGEKPFAGEGETEPDVEPPEHAVNKPAAAPAAKVEAPIEAPKPEPAAPAETPITREEAESLAVGPQAETPITREEAESLAVGPPAEPAKPATKSDELLTQLAEDKSGRTSPKRTKLYQNLGAEAVPGIRLGDAEEAGRLFEMTRKGEATQAEWDKWVADAKASGRVSGPGVEAPTAQAAPPAKPIEEHLNVPVPDVTEARGRVKSVDKYQADLREQAAALDKQIKDLEKVIKPQRGNAYTRSKIKASAKKSDVAKYNELRKQYNDLGDQISAMDKASKADRDLIDSAVDAEIISDPKQPLARRLDRRIRQLGDKAPPELVKAYEAETDKLIKQHYPDATPEESAKLKPELQRLIYFGDTIRPGLNAPDIFALRRNSLAAAINSPTVPKHLFPDELKAKLNRFSAADRAFTGKNEPVENLSAEDLADLQTEIADTTKKIHEEQAAAQKKAAADKAAEEAKVIKMMEEAEAVAASAVRSGKKGGRTAKEVRADLVERVRAVIQDVVNSANTALKTAEDGGLVAESDAGVARGTIEETKNGFRVTVQKMGSEKDNVTAVVKTREEAEQVIKAMASGGSGKVVIGVPGDGVFTLNKWGPSLLKLWVDARKMEVSAGGGKPEYTTTGGAEAPPETIKTADDWQEAKDYHGLRPDDKIWEFSQAMRNIARKVNDGDPENVTTKMVDDWLDRKKAGLPAERAPEPAAEPEDAGIPTLETETPGASERAHQQDVDSVKSMVEQGFSKGSILESTAAKNLSKAELDSLLKDVPDSSATLDRAIEIEKSFKLDPDVAHFFNVALDAVEKNPEKWSTLAEGVQKEAMRVAVAAGGKLDKVGDLKLAKKLAEKYLTGVEAGPKPQLQGMGGALAGQEFPEPRQAAVAGAQVEQAAPQNRPMGILSNVGSALRNSWQALVTFAKGAAGDTLPKITAAAREVGEAGARYLSSRIAAIPRADVFVARVLQDTDVDPFKFGAALTEDNLQSIRQSFRQAAEQERANGNIDAADELDAQAQNVATIIGSQGSPFATMDEFLDYINEPGTRRALDQHKQLWQEVIDPTTTLRLSGNLTVSAPSRKVMV